MKKHTKIFAELVIFFIFIFALFIPFIFTTKMVSALAVDESTFRNAAYYVTSFENQRPKQVFTTIRGTPYIFQDSNTQDTNINLKPPVTPVGIICSAADGIRVGEQGGITVTASATNVPGGGYAYPARLILKYKEDDTMANVLCTQSPTRVKVLDITIQLQYGTPGSPPYTGNPPPPPGTQPPQDDNQTQNASNTCEASWSSPLTWIICPLFAIATGMTQTLIDLFESQLCFRTEVSQNQAIKCKATDVSSVQPAWTAIKNIVSALIVVIMLIAIFAQALSVGPIDAYTLRRLIPRLAAAVILIQISFYLFTWIINVVDDIGEGLAALLQTVFAANTRGVNINNFYSLLDNAGVGIITLAGVNWALIVTLIGAAIFAGPTLLLLFFAAVVALLVALATLIFRKVIIIALLIIAPVALLLWVLPNTERYWKMYWDNFLKVLLMFPIIVLIIEAGRVFAFVAGPASGGGLIALFIVMVGFFGPLFILPKTFRWGGTLMAMTGGAMERAGGSLGKPGREYLEWRKGLSRWSQARAIRRGVLEQKYRTGFAEGLSSGGFRGKINRARLLGISRHEGEIREKAGLAAKGAVAQEAAKQIQGYFDSLGYDVGGKPKGSAREFEAAIKGHTTYIDEDGKERAADTNSAMYILGSKLREAHTNEERLAIAKKVAQYREVESLKHFRDFVQSKEGGEQDWSTYANSGYLYDDFRALDTQLLERTRKPGGFFTDQGALTVSDKILAGQTSVAWKDLVSEAEAKFGRDEGRRKAIEAFQRATALPAAENMDDSARQYMLSIARTDAPPGAGTTPFSSTPAVGPSAAPESRPSASTLEAGELRVPHEELHTPGYTGYPGVTPYQEAHIQNELFNLTEKVKRGESLSPEEQKRFDQLRNIIPPRSQ